MGFGSALASVGGNLIGNYFGNQSAKREAERNRGFQAHMSNTSYQRATQDLQAAGLNPALAYGQGGASSPGGSTANIEKPDIGTDILNSALAKKELKLKDALIKKTEAETGLTSTKDKMSRPHGTMGNILNDMLNSIGSNSAKSSDKPLQKAVKALNDNAKSSAKPWNKHKGVPTRPWEK